MQAPRSFRIMTWLSWEPFVGTVHAGASGNRKALVFALRMQPTQLRIAELITQPSKEDKRSQRFESEIAFIEGESIIIEICQKIRL